MFTSKKISSFLFKKELKFIAPKFLHITASVGAKDKDGKVRCILLKIGEETDYDLTLSKNTLISSIPEYLKKSEFLLLRVNQTVIDPGDWDKRKLEVIYFGHASAGIFKIDGNLPVFFPGTLTSKIDTGYQGEEETINELFKPRKDKQIKVFSESFICLIDLAKTNLSKEVNIKSNQSLIKLNEKYDKVNNACGQAVFFALTGKNLGNNVSAQRAINLSVQEIVQDKFLLENINSNFKLFGLPTPAYSLGEKYIYEKLLEEEHKNRY